MNKENIFNSLNIKFMGDFSFGKISHFIIIINATSINFNYENDIIGGELKEDIKYNVKRKYIEDNLLKHISLDSIEFDEETIKALDIEDNSFIRISDDRYILDGVKSLYDFFKEAGVTDVDYLKLSEHLKLQTLNMQSIMAETVHKSMENGSKKESISQAFMEVQAILEFSSCMLFPENINKAGSEWSWRERLVRNAYISRKYEIDKIRDDKNKRG